MAKASAGDLVATAGSTAILGVDRATALEFGLGVDPGLGFSVVNSVHTIRCVPIGIEVESRLAEDGPVHHSYGIITDLLPDRLRCEVEMMRRGGKLPRRTSGYDSVLTDVVQLIESARRSAARSVNSVLTTTYWEIERRIVEQEQRGEARAGYAEKLMMRLATDLAARCGRGFGWRNLFQMRAFYLAYRQRRGASSTESFPEMKGRKLQTVSAMSGSAHPATPDSGFALPWSHYVPLVALRSEEAERFYQAEALRGGWTIRQLGRRIDSRFYEGTLLSKNKAVMLRRGERPAPDDAVTPEEEVKDPYVLELLGLRDEYSETEAVAGG